ncbi:pilus assembly protein [Pseudoxanthomonas suwonensis]|uniref:pilus assembly protein n=1 Tax=Pseudoxanthomonas suwonensis TaxID=314722 RepID=UPI00138F290F|nr:PilC/PilY family type IV pilus protein [Pseudoxanthomonas suwonensis]KAF1703644.1 pilus assembly protein [Pseudoxanthomonas suwonensis]
MNNPATSAPRPAPSRASRIAAIAVGLCAAFCSVSAFSGVAIDRKPLTVTNSVPGNMVLLPSVEWPTVVTHANAPGVAEGSANYSTSTAYAGYFNSELCYAYNYDPVEANRYFYPVVAASNRSCSGRTGGTVTQRLWSGNFLNWAAMQAVDTFRLALTGGYRVHRPADGTPPSVSIIGSNGSAMSKATSEMPGVTYLEKGNSDRFETGYTPLRRLNNNTLVAGATPAQTSGFRARIGGLRNQMWFGLSTNISLGNSQSWNDPRALALPVTSGIQPAPGDSNVSAVPYNPSVHSLANSATSCPSGYSYSSAKARCTSRNGDRDPNSYGNDAVYAVSIRVKVCDGVLDTRSMCTRYGSYYKPEGLLQGNAKKTRYSLFAYLTESGQNRNGGVMRARQKLIGPVTAAELAGTEKPYPDRTGRIPNIDNPEWDPVTGVIINDPDTSDSAATSARIGTCGTGSGDPPDGSRCTVRYSGVINYLNRFGQIHTGMATLKAYDNLSEMYYTALRYMRGVGNLSAYSNLTGSAQDRYRNADGMPVIEDWYGTGANSAVTRWTADTTVGSNADPILYRCQANVFLGIGDTATNNEDANHSGNGDISNNFVSEWLGYTEGDNTNRNYTAALAYWAHINDIRSDVPNVVLSTNPERKRGQSISTYWVDVVELNDLKSARTNQYYLATKYGGYAIPEESYDANGNAQRQSTAWFNTNRSVWTSATQNAKQQTGLGGTGDFYLPNNMYLANNGEAMIRGLEAAFRKIADDVSGSGSSFASNSTKLEVGSRTYQAKYISNGWGGRLTASDVDVNTGTLTDRWDASDWLGQAAGDTKVNPDAVTLHYSQRKLLYANASSASGLSNFINGWTGAVQANPSVIKPTGFSGLTDDQLKYILGDRTHERQSTANNSLRTFRNRRGMLGDIINSTPIYVGRPNANLHPNDPSYASFASQKASRKPVVYVGANDGMLHAFQAPDSGNANAGRELFAFMPTEAMAVLQQNDPASGRYPYWDPEYDHAYSVDGELTVADVKDGETWKTILVGTMGRGGKTIFALDVTDPDNPKLLWEKTGSDSQVGFLLGNALGRPIIAKVADGDWRVFLGNGPNSTSDASALIMLDVITGANRGSRSTGVAGDNGLGPVNVWDDHGTVVPSKPDGNFDTVYAGDMRGNLWKFDLDANSTTLLFTTRTGQPITVAPLVARNPYRPPETWLFFGTGRYLSMADTSVSANAVVQSWYGIIDRGTLVAHNSLNQSTIDYEDSKGRVISKVAAAGTNGWYIDLQSPEEADGTVAARGERMVVPNFFQGMALIGTTRFPDSNDPCAPSGKGFTMAIDPFTGGRLNGAFFDIDQSGTVGDSGDYQDGDTSTPYSGVAYDSGPNNPIFLGSYMYTSLDDGTYAKYKTSGSQAAVRRVSWRELINNGN